MKVVIFRWDVRERPPYFGGARTWVYTKKMSFEFFDKKAKEKIEKSLKKIHDFYRTKYYKIVFFNKFGRRTYILKTKPTLSNFYKFL